MAYAVKEIFFTLQGEGANGGRPAVFCRFAGCNLWNGLESSRHNARCYFCDTDFVGTDGVGGGSFVDAAALAETIAGYWPEQLTPRISLSPSLPPATVRPLVVFTGGEPLLQLDRALIRAVKRLGFVVAVETNGTIAAPFGSCSNADGRVDTPPATKEPSNSEAESVIDWLTVSPKPNSELVQRSGTELKLVYPHEVTPESVAELDFQYFFLSPMTITGDPDRSRNNALAALDYCQKHPKWRLTLQYHKFLGLR